MIKVIEVSDKNVWAKRKSYDKEIEELLKQALAWDDKTKMVEFEKPHKSLRSILKKEFPKKEVKARPVDKDPKRWLIQLGKVKRKRLINSNRELSLSGAV